LLNILGARIGYFHQVLPRLGSRSFLLDLGGNVLTSLFDVATIADLHQLHLTLDELKSKYADIVHSLPNRTTYMRNLDNTARVNTNAIANLYSTAKDFIIRLHDRFGKMTADILCLNVKIHSQSEIYIAVRQLEFSLLQLIQQVDELAAIHFIL